MARNIPSTARIYQLDVTLQETEPPIWRRVQVPAEITVENTLAFLRGIRPPEGEQAPAAGNV